MRRWRETAQPGAPDIPDASNAGDPIGRRCFERLMLHVSDILIERHDLRSFAELVDAVEARAKEERFLRIDVKPPFADTPENWEDVLESTFTAAAGR